ncbi:DNA-binding transcriptional regulator, MarR family [Ferrithrix thermotolerans DSM 19514]|uniref:DNA-binding transcriptional regulator, MarR family n=2 Tax=Ferrithrix TaxID=643949 RepID=A0A1M4UBF7_9ACTN|nr:DNA-binding transcriptional regulator, MarR family [Ferrithrix thermotolerans DSM 19514]
MQSGNESKVYEEDLESHVKHLEKGLFQLARSLRKIRVGGEATPTYATGAGFWELVLLKHRHSMRSSEIASSLAIDISTVSRQIKVLEHAGLVKKEPDSNDARAAIISLTKKGEEIVDQLIKKREDTVRRALEGWSVEDRECLIRLLDRLVVGLDSDEN